jgi:hypothetical protein
LSDLADGMVSAAFYQFSAQEGKMEFLEFVTFVKVLKEIDTF